MFSPAFHELAFFYSETLFCLCGLFGGVDTVLYLALEDFGQEFSAVQKEVIVHVIKDKIILGVIAGIIGVGEESLELEFGGVAGSDGEHRTSLSIGFTPLQ
jgi:hypothetical protein